MAKDKSCAFRFKSDIITNGNWSNYMFCTVDTFKRWVATTRALNNCGVAEYTEKFKLINEIQVHIARTDRTYVYTDGAGWRDATDDPPFDIKEQIPTATNFAFLGNGQTHEPTDDELYGGKRREPAAADFGKPAWFILPMTSGVVSDYMVFNEQLLLSLDTGFVRNKFVDSIDFTAEGMIG